MKRIKPKDGSDEPPADGDARNREADFHGEKPLGEWGKVLNSVVFACRSPEATLVRRSILKMRWSVIGSLRLAGARRYQYGP